MEEEKRADELAKALLKWIKGIGSKPTITSEFFSKHKIPWRRFNDLKKKYPKLDAAYQMVCADLDVRWFNFAMKQKDLPPHQVKIALKYLFAYDSHLWQMKNDQYEEMKKERYEIFKRVIPEF